LAATTFPQEIPWKKVHRH